MKNKVQIACFHDKLPPKANSLFFPKINPLQYCHKKSSEGSIYLAQNDEDTEGEVGIVTKEDTLCKKPSMYKVILLNDDYTPMDFVVTILTKYFNKDHTAATKIMLNVHNDGRGICGVYTFEIAETKVRLVTEEARKHKYPLECIMEQE